MIKESNLKAYSNDQINGLLKNLKGGRRLYSIVAIVFIVLTLAFGVASIVSMIIYILNHNMLIRYLTLGLVIFCVACLIVMMAMLITIKFKYSDPIRIIEKFKAGKK